MPNMVLGSYTFEENPSDVDDIFRPLVKNAAKKTYSSSVYFTWGSTLIGKEIVFTWNFMSCSMFDSLDALYQTNNDMIFNPNNGSGLSLTCEVTGLTGKYFMGFGDTANITMRTNVVLTLLVKGIS